MFTDYLIESKLIPEHVTRKGFKKVLISLLRLLLAQDRKNPTEDSFITAGKTIPFTSTTIIQISLSDLIRCKRIFDSTALNLLQHYNQTILVS